MGGIAGIVSLKNVPMPIVEEMMGAISHRGPDEIEFFHGGTVQIGACGLKLGGINDGNLIAINRDRTVISVFSGTLFNIPALIRCFLREEQLDKTCCPSALILHLYENCGIDLLNVIDGQFALAIYDKRRDIVILARDAVGVCPLYYAVTNDTVLFGSEIKALSIKIKIQPSIRGLYENFVYWSTSGGRTIYQDIFQVPPAGFAVIENNKIQVQGYNTYAHPEFIPNKRKSAAEYQEDIYLTLVQSIADRVARPGKWGIYLSGGLDSTILLKLVERMGFGDIPIFSLGFAEGEVDESAYQSLATSGYGGEHQRVTVGDAEIIAALPQVLKSCETPLFKLGAVPMFLLAQAARQRGVEFILSGEGADELFYGYDLFKESKLRHLWPKYESARQAARDIEHVVPPQYKSNPRALKVYSEFYSRYLDQKDDVLYCMRPRIDASTEIIKYFSTESRAMIAPREVDILVGSQFKHNSSVLKQCQDIQMQILLAGYLLSVQGDRVLMANSIQGRFPFLDRRMIELSRTIPDNLKLCGYEEKYILKKAFADIVPLAILQREKYQYSAPGAEIFLRNKLVFEPYLAKETFQRFGIFDYKASQSLVHNLQASSGQAHQKMTDRMILTYIITAHMLFDLIKG